MVMSAEGPGEGGVNGENRCEPKARKPLYAARCKLQATSKYSPETVFPFSFLILNF
jgi:hypothetical protein